MARALLRASGACGTVLLLLLPAAPTAAGPTTTVAAGPTGSISLVSATPAGRAADGPSFSGTERGLGVSAHGRHVVFSSYASDLVPADTNGERDVFVRDTVTGHTVLASVSTGGLRGDAESRQGSISADGRYVAFNSYATNLVPGDTNNAPDVFVRDLWTGRTALASVGAGGPADLGAHQPELSADGRYVSFTSAATNLVPGDTNDSADVFVRDLRTGRTERVSVRADGGQADTYSGDSSISRDGRFVTFLAGAGLAPTPEPPAPTSQVVYVRDRVAGTTRAVSPGVPVDPRAVIVEYAYPTLSEDGRFLLFTVVSWLGVGVDPIPNVWLRNLTTGALELISADSAGRPSSAVGPVFRADLSADGRFVAFGTPQPLHPADRGVLSDVFLRDRRDGRLTWITRAQDQTDPFGGRIGSVGPAIAPDGRYVAFESDDKLLAPPGGAAGYDTYLWRAAR